MTITTLTENYFEYMNLHHQIKHQSTLRKVMSMLLHKLEKPRSFLTSFERDYVRWVVSLHDRKINIAAIKAEIRKLQESFKGAKLHHLEKDVIRFTKLCALQAALRGKLHFSSNTNIAEARFHRKLPVKNRGYDRESNLWLGTIDLEVQKNWVSDLAEEFCQKETA